MKYLISKFLLLIFLIVVMVFSMRGNMGNITPADFNDKYWTENGPLELSPERGRFALIYSIIEDKSLQYSKEVAQLAAPDVAVTTEGKYVTLFAPGVSLVALPGYLIGKYFGFSLVGVYSVVALFAIINTFFVMMIARRLGANEWAATIGGLIFILATPALAYAVDLYQHHMSVFLILLSVYSLLKWPGVRALLIIFLSTGISIIIDNPNIIMMLPVIVAAFGQIISLKIDEEKVKLNLNFWRILTGLIIILPIAGFLYFNQLSHNNAFQLSGTLPSVQEVDTKGEIFISDIERVSNEKLDVNTTAQTKNAVSFFETRNLLDGFYTHFFSPDRGMLYFTPVMFLVVAAIILLYRRKIQIYSVLLGIILFNIVIYSLWGDYFGGWAFGSRYLIPTYAIGSIMLALSLHYWRRSVVWILLVLILSIYSTSVNVLGAISSSANPPKIEVLELEKLTGSIQRYSYDRNWDVVTNNKLKSVLYRSVFENSFNGQQYYYICLGFILPILSGLILGYLITNLKDRKKVKNV